MGGAETEKRTVSEREVKRKKPQKHSATRETQETPETRSVSVGRAEKREKPQKQSQLTVSECGYEKHGQQSRDIAEKRITALG